MVVMSFLVGMTNEEGRYPIARGTVAASSQTKECSVAMGIPLVLCRQLPIMERRSDLNVLNAVTDTHQERHAANWRHGSLVVEVDRLRW